MRASVTFQTLEDALGALTSISAVAVAPFASPMEAAEAFSSARAACLSLMAEALSERDAEIARLESEVARLASILANDHTNCGATTAVDRQSATGHKGPAKEKKGGDDGEAAGDSSGGDAAGSPTHTGGDAPDGEDAKGDRPADGDADDGERDDRPANTYNQREADGKPGGEKRGRGGQEGHPGTTLGEDALLRALTLMAALGLAPEWVDVGDPDDPDVTLRYRLGLELVPTARIFRCHGGCQAPVGGYSAVAYDDNLAATCCYLRTECNVSLNRIATLVRDGTGGCLRPREGTVTNFQYRLADACGASVEAIVEDLLSAGVVYTDATYVFKDGKCAYIRNFSTGDSVLYVPLGRKSLEALRGIDFLKGYHGILVHDHEVVMYHFGTRHGECIVHVIRYCRKNAEDTGNDWPSELAKMLTEANARKRELQAQGATEMPPEELGEFIRRYEAIVADGWRQGEETVHDWARKKEAAFLRRLRKYEAQHLMFITDFEVDWSNNVSERDLRKAKRHSKVTGGFRDDRGMDAYCTALSVTETMRRRGINVWEGIRWVLENGGNAFGPDGPSGASGSETE